MRNIFLAGGVALVSLVLSCGAQAQAPTQTALTGTLKKIQDTNVMTLGVRDASFPFSYSDNNGKTIGYSQEIALKIVDEVKRRLNRPNLEVKFVPITSQNRIPLMQNGTIDLECGSTTNTFDREKQVAFSDSIFLYGVRMVSKKSSNIHDFPDLAGKTVASTAGTSDEKWVRKLNEDKKMNMRVISPKEHSEAFMDVASGRAAAFVMDEPLLYGEKAKADHPDDYVVNGTPDIKENYACMLRKDDAPFKQLVDKVVAHLETSGEAEKLYTKWFMSPTPPNNVNMNYPLSAEMKELFAHPNDKALD
jgi:glutamate/aspartate transport system substrate-binding protein